MGQDRTSAASAEQDAIREANRANEERKRKIAAHMHQPRTCRSCFNTGMAFYTFKESGVTYQGVKRCLRCESADVWGLSRNDIIA